jgi:hypothetical protein
MVVGKSSILMIIFKPFLFIIYFIKKIGMSDYRYHK